MALTHEEAIDVRRLDFIDYPMGWALQREIGTNSPPHDPRCSCVEGWDPLSGPMFLCDCGAIKREWARRREALGLPGPATEQGGQTG